MKEKEIGEIVDSWIAQEELPRRANLKVIKSFDPYEGMDLDEVEAYLEFRGWYMAKDHTVLLSIPKCRLSLSDPKNMSGYFTYWGYR
jgi:hypothetical protein